MEKRLGGTFGQIELLGTRDRTDCMLRIRPLDRDEALRLLRGSTLDPAEMVEIRRWWYREKGLSARRTRGELLADLAEAACAGRIAFGYRPMVVSEWGGYEDTPAAPEPTATAPNRPVRPAPAPRPEQPSPGSALSPASGATEVQTWVEFRLLDEATGTPISGVEFRIELPDASVVNRITDGAGKIRIDGIDPGSCGIREIVLDTGPEVTNVM